MDISHNTEEGKYDLSYNNPSQLPKYLEYKNDSWGYYNGLADDFSSYSAFLNSRVTNPSCLMYGLLEKITYPTGGYSKFVFEPNEYSKCVKRNRYQGIDEFSYNTYAGGVRIRDIINSDNGSDEYINKHYTYNRENNHNLSSGVLNTPIEYLVSYSFEENHQLYQYETFISHPMLPSSSTGKSTIVGYTDVNEYNADNTVCKYHFSNFDTGQIDEDCDVALIDSTKFLGKYNSRDTDRGLLLSQTLYLDSNCMNAARQNTYSYRRDSENYAHSYNLNRSLPIHDGQAYKIYTYSMLPESEEETVYESNGSIKTTTRYAYNDFNQLSSKAVYNGNTEIEKEIHSYVGDYTNNNMFAAMTNRNMLFPVETTKYINGLAVSSSLNTYKENFRTGNYVNDKTYKRTFTPATASPLFYDGAVIPSSYGAAELTYKSYDNFDNITDFCKKDGIDTGIIWDAQGEHPLMVATNAEVNDTNIVVTYPYVNNTVEFYQYSTPRTITFTSGCDNSYFGISVAQRNNTKWKVCGTIDGNQTFCIVDAMDEVPDRSWQGYGCSYSTTLSAGFHYINITSVEVIGNPNYNGENIANLTYGYQKKQVTACSPSYQDLFYENFDVSGNSNGGFLGTKCHTGNFNVAFAVNPSRNYFIDYLAWDSATSTWKYHRNDFNGSFSFSGSMKIDNVRVYPKDSQVNSYTFCNGLGMTSKTDGKGITTFYHFDKAGRLNGISDSERGSIERYEYFYNNR